MEKKNYLSWGQKIDTIEDCEKLINESYWFLIAMAGLLFVLSIFTKNLFQLLPDVIFMVIVAFSLKKYQSRSIATIIFLYSILICIITFGNKLHLPFAKSFGGGTNIFLAIMFVYVAFKTMQAAYKLFNLRNLAISWKNFGIKSLIFIVLLFITSFVAGVASAIVGGNEILTGLFVIIAIFLSIFVAYAGWFPKSDKLKIKYVKYIQHEVE